MADLIANNFNINEFRNRLGDGARPNQFHVAITGPGVNVNDPALNLGSLGGIQNFRYSQYLVTAASLPGQSIGVAPVYYRGRELKLAGDRNYQPWATTILNDQNLTLRASLEAWMATIENMGRKDGSTNLAAYSGTLTVTQLNKNGDPIKAYALLNAWPADISEVPLSFDANDQVSAFTCTWVYQYFETVATTAEGFATQALGSLGSLGG